MEHHANSVDDALIGGLSYKLKSGASYVTNRRSVSYFAQGGNDYKPSGVRVMKFHLTGDQWMDPSTFRVAFQLNNLDYDAASSNYVQPLSWNPAVFFRRARIIAGGQVIEYIDDFNRLSLMLSSLKSGEEQLMIASEGFNSFDEQYADVAQDNRKTYRNFDYDKSGSVFEGRRVIFKPMFGIFNQEKLLPLRYMPLQIELELVNAGGDAVHVGAWEGQNNTANWSISDIQCKCDLLTLDNALDNEYASHLLSGKSLPINFRTWNHTNQSTGNDKNFSANINRALTRLKSVFITLQGVEGAWDKQCNDFFHPIAVQAIDRYSVSDEHQYQVQIGSKLIPEYPVKSLSESLSQLRKTVGSPFQMYGRWYRTRKYIIGLDLEKVSGAGFTGMSTKAGDLMTLNFRDCEVSGVGGSTPHRVFCALNYDCVVNIQDSGLQVLD